ncbi:transporter substrate-binding domain-containing protein [Roseateles asaccharophilus]|uniref:Polar amino acid transport system substrate-binding protein n=1 Tax=Roseateles asaccharophilus TaxID=582607 RepID=A0ABU2AAX1_9BURK|nr:transporter substrate-binding domain-containing protein [Roseateles asaccharophilus]MDR7334356.1 polar amino acid transport system substrate-binding protein [Roseateles asaccharophilus]
MLRRQVGLWGLGWALEPLAAPPASASSLRLLSEEFPPVNYTDAGRPSGLAVEVVQAVLQRLGQKLEIEFLPWARAYREAQGRQPTGLFAAARIPEREKLFQWVGPIVTFYSSFYARAGAERLKRLDDARQASDVLVVRDWYTAQQLASEGFRNLRHVSDPAQALRMLLARRAPLFASERISMQGALAAAGVDPAALKEVYTFASSEGYIAFSLGTPKHVVSAWQLQVDAMKRDGSFQAIYKRWLPHDLPPR